VALLAVLVLAALRALAHNVIGQDNGKQIGSGEQESN